MRSFGLQRRRRGSAAPRGGCARIAVRVLIAAFAAAAAMTGSTQATTLFFPRAIAEETDALYNHNCFWGGPRGMDYAALPEPQPIQIPNLYPDKGSTYFVAQFEMPEVGSRLTIHGMYPRERYFSFTVANELGGGVVGNGEFLRDNQIEPDPGSVNPYQITPTKSDRTPIGQTYTLYIARVETIPEHPAANTLYAKESTVRLSMRNYIPDEGLGGTGGVDLPTVTLTLQNGEEVTEPEAVCKALKNNKEGTITGFPQATWEKQIAKSSEPENAPAKKTPEFELFWNNNYNILGSFIENRKTRVEKYAAKQEGGYATNPDTRYALAGLSLKFGNVVVVHGKLPTYQHTRPSATKWSYENPQIRYWSICTAQGPVSGHGADCAYDQQVPLNQNGDYTIVISKSGQRPANASTMCGVKWLNFGTGEGEVEGSTPPNRSWIGIVYARYMDALSGVEWPQSPKNIPEPTTNEPSNQLEKVMGEYAPVAEYSNQATYEGKGCAGGAPSLAAPSSTPNSGAFTLHWSAPTNALPQLYTLQHKHVGGSWETVASGLSAAEYTFPAGSPEAEGTWTYRVAAVDTGEGETERPEEGGFGAESETVKVQRSGPPAPTASVSRPPDYSGDGGWYRDSVEVSFSANGPGMLPDGSEGASLEPASLTPTQTVEDSGSHEVCGTVENVLGEKSEPGCVTVQVDATPPSLEISCPAMVAIGSSASATVTASDLYSGLKTDPSGTVPIDTSKAGEQTITRTAVSNAGLETTKSCSTFVGYYVVVSGPVNGALTVRSGEAFELTSTARVSGAVHLRPGGALDIEGAALESGLTAKKAALLRVCGASVAGTVAVKESTGALVIGEGTPGCAATTFAEAVAITGNAAGVLIDGNVLGSHLTVKENAGGTTVTDNKVSGKLTVTGNTGTVVDEPNEVKGKSKLQLSERGAASRESVSPGRRPKSWESPGLADPLSSVAALQSYALS